MDHDREVKGEAYKFFIKERRNEVNSGRNMDDSSFMNYNNSVKMTNEKYFQRYKDYNSQLLINKLLWFGNNAGFTM